MIAILRFHWHRFREWRHLILSGRAFDAAERHLARAGWHKRSASAIRPPPSTGPPDLANTAEGQHAPAQDGP